MTFLEVARLPSLGDQSVEPLVERGQRRSVHPFDWPAAGTEDGRERQTVALGDPFEEIAGRQAEAVVLGAGRSSSEYHLEDDFESDVLGHVTHVEALTFGNPGDDLLRDPLHCSGLRGEPFAVK